MSFPIQLTDSAREVREECAPRSPTAQKNSFVVSGKGGLPASPEAVITGDRPLVNLVSLVPNGSNQATQSAPSSVSTNTEPSKEATGELVEAQAWIQGKNGEIYLIADSDIASIHRQGLASPACALH